MTRLQQPSCSDGPIWDVWLAAFHAPSLAIADELGVFARLHDQPQTALELSSSLEIELRASEALLALMASLGFLSQLDGRYHVNDVARTYLVPTSPFYWGGFLRRIRDIPLDCNKLLGSLRRGTSAGDARVSGQLWKAPQPPPPEALHSFTHAMHSHSFALAMRVVRELGLANAQRWLDVAGGSGSYTIAAALTHPELSCTLLDLPVVTGIAHDYAQRYGVGERVTTIAADMFRDAWPMGFDRIFMADIFHDWDDDQCLWLARRAFESLAPGGRFLLHEMILDGDSPRAAAAYSMVMVFVTEGRQRSSSELSTILATAGFTDIQLTLTAEGYALVSGARS